MGRIRSIKPEFSQSETIGSLSRDARLLFVQLWTIVDDEGRTRAASRMLASLLYPYDDDARDMIDGWINELVIAECIVRYSTAGSSYLQVCNWAKHQKIDHPSKSKLPGPDGSSVVLAKPREQSREALEPSRSLAPDLGSRIRDLGSGEDLGSRSVSLRSTEPRVRESEIDLEFETVFWPSWPNKVGKPAALRAWRAARRKHATSTILAGVSAYVETKPPDRPWLNPATFLNGERWNDQPAPVARGSPAPRLDGVSTLLEKLRSQVEGGGGNGDFDDESGGYGGAAGFGGSANGFDPSHDAQPPRTHRGVTTLDLRPEPPDDS